MKIYQIIIIGILMFSISSFFSSSSGQTFAQQIKEVAISNFPTLQSVSVENTNPIDVNVVNPVQPFSEVLVINSEPINVASLSAATSTFWGNECGINIGDMSPAIDTNGYSTLIVHAFSNTGSGFSFQPFGSVDGVNWTRSKNIQITDSNLMPIEILAPQYSIKVVQGVSGSLTECFTFRGYLIP